MRKSMGAVFGDAPILESRYAEQQLPTFMPKIPMNAPFQDLFFADADPDELNQRDPAALAAIAKAHWALVQDAKVGEVRVDVLKASEALVDGTTVVQIVHPDMAFLVDSVSIAVNQSGRTVHWIVHPLLRITRDDAGKVARLESAASSAQTGNKGSVVSCILVECTRLASDPDGEALCRAIESTLLDVRCAVRDWRAMLSRVQLLSAGFTALDGAEAAESKAFLTWLETEVSAS